MARKKVELLSRPIGITRVERKSKWGWWTVGYQANFSHDGRRYSKFFADGRAGGEILAWSQACTWLWRTRQEVGAPWKFRWNWNARPPKPGPRRKL